MINTIMGFLATLPPPAVFIIGCVIIGAAAWLFLITVEDSI